MNWKLWAFSTIDTGDAQELYTNAITAGIIWPKGSIFNKTEFWSKENKKMEPVTNGNSAFV